MTRIHLSLRTADLDSAIAFYTSLFGEEPDKRRDGYARFQPANTPIVLALMPGDPGVDHFGLRTSTTELARAHWKAIAAAGTPLAPAEGVVCCHARKDEAWLRDPDGNAWEVYAVTDESPEVVKTSSGCCA